MTITVGMKTVDVAAPTAIAELLAGPAVATKERIASVSVANQNAVGGASILYALSRYDGATDVFGFARNAAVAPGQTITMRDIFVPYGRSLRHIASAAGLHVCVDYLEQTVS